MFNRREQPVTVTRVWGRQNIIIAVLSIFVVLSVLLNAYTFATVYQTRMVVRAHLAAAADKIGEARQQSIHYNFPVNQSFPVNTTIQLNESLTVPINMTVPIQQRITVPVDVPVLGTMELPVNLDFDVPISTTVPVVIDKELPIATSVDLNTEIPLDIDLGQPPLGDVLRDLETALRGLLDQF